MNNPLAVIIASLSMAVSSGTMVYSVIVPRQEVHINPELERLALAYFQDQEDRRVYGHTVDAANHAAEQKLVIPLPSQSREFDDLPRLDIPVSTPKPR
jgi:hypothetical protein